MGSTRNDGVTLSSWKTEYKNTENVTGLNLMHRIKKKKKGEMNRTNLTIIILIDDVTKLFLAIDRPNKAK